jgi:quinol monooxygenase YgiN
MTAIVAGDRPVTLINVFTVDPEHQDDLVKLLVEATDQVIRHRPGFVSVNVHASLDGTRVVNYAQWDSRSDLEAMLADPQSQAHISEISALARSAPQLYRVAGIVER